jgi:hypothetical protein
MYPDKLGSAIGGEIVAGVGFGVVVFCNVGSASEGRWLFDTHGWQCV